MFGFIDDLFGGDDASDISGRSAKVSGQTYQNMDDIINASRAQAQNLPYYANSAAAGMSEQAANEAYNQDKQIKANASNKGLLYSGLRQGQQAQGRANISAALMQRRANLNKDLMNQSFSNQASAAGTGLDVGTLQGMANNQSYRAYSGAQQQDPGFVGGLLKGLTG